MTTPRCRALLSAATTLLPLAVLGCATSQPHTPNPNEIVIGVAGPMSGNLSKFGQQEKRGVELAIQDINAAGGLLGKKLRLRVSDDSCDPDRAISEAKDMISNSAVMVVGPFCSSSAIDAVKIYGPNQVMQFAVGAVRSELTGFPYRQGWTTIFRVINVNYRQADFAANWMLKKFPHGRFALLYDAWLDEGVLMNHLDDDLHQAGIQPVVDQSFPEKLSDPSDIAAILTVLKNSKPDVIYVDGYHFDVAKILQAARSAGIMAAFVGTDTLNTSEFPEQAGGYADGVRFTDAVVPVSAPETAKIIARLSAEDKDNQGFAIPAYAAVQAWAAGVTRAGTTEGAKVASAIRSQPVDTALGRLSWDKEGEIEQLRYAWFVWHGGTFTMEGSN